MSAMYEQIAKDALAQLQLGSAESALDAAAQRAAAEGWSYTHFLGYLLDAELRERRRKRAELNTQFARFPAIKDLASFDFSAQPSIDKRLFDELATGRFHDEGRNIVLLGPPGVGKTHLAIALGYQTAQMGRRVFFANTMDLVTKLTKAIDGNRLHRELNYLMQPKLLILDEVGYLRLDSVQASLLFQVICKRYQKHQSVILTSNKPFSEWDSVFGGDSVMASAALDRLLHRSTVVNIRGESFRMREKKHAGSSTL